MADRYFLPHFPEDDRWAAECALTGSEFHHLVHVMRLGIGDRLTVFDGQGTEADAEIVGITKTSAALRLAEPRRDPPPVRAKVVLATAVPKADRLRWLVEKAAELGVDRFIPLQTGRSIVAPGAVKLDKMRQVVVEACKQSGRNQLMQIDSLMSWKQFVAQEVAPLSTVVADPDGPPLSTLDVPVLRKADVRLVIGPEGGLSAAELQEALEAGAKAVSLGTNILRVETAALALAAVFLMK
jgi:16S rRNA (uracil1498-N3)-methyltransferase